MQKVLLQCLLSTVYGCGCNPPTSQSSTFSEAVLDFNNAWSRSQAIGSDYGEALQVGILRLLLVLIVLEDQVTNHWESDRNKNGLQGQGSAVRYQQGVSIPSQPMFSTAVLYAIKQQRARHLHRHWLALVTSSLPFLGPALGHVAITVTNQLCQNLELLAVDYQASFKHSDEPSSSGSPVDYVMTLLDGLTTLCHYCLLDSPVLVSTVLTQAGGLSTSNTNSHPYMSRTGVNAGQILSNLVNVFSPSSLQREQNMKRDGSPPVDPMIVARHNMLVHLPRIVSALSNLWQAVTVADKMSTHQPAWIMGTPKAVKQKILELLSPVSHHHSINFMAAIAWAWNEKRRKGPINSKKVILASTEKQLVMVDLVSAIKVMPMDTVVQTVRHVVKQPPSTNSSQTVKVVPLEVSMLQFFYAYVQTASGSTLQESWTAVLALLREGLQLVMIPPAQFLMLGILNEFVQRAPMLEEKKDQRDLQDIAQRLIEAVSAMAGACLEQTTWLRRNLAVRPGPQPDIPDSDSELDEAVGRTSELSPAANETPVTLNGPIPKSDMASQYSVQALSILAELLAPLLDVIYVSDEKEKMVPLLTNIMYNVTPYLRNHSQHNVPSFRACSQLMASLSEYQHTRKAWRKDALELLLDPIFFQMTEQCLIYWQTTVDNLMTHEKTTFRDLMARVAMAQSGSLNLFSSKEQEYEQRAQLLKRLAFVLLSGEMDQYQNFMPEIQERLSESLRIPQVPSVQAQVFLCCRVLLLRMSPQHITSLWPIIITEMVQVFLQIEQELNKDSEEFGRQTPSSHLRRLSTLDTSWVVSPSNGLNAHNHPAWLQMYLAVCKLLDLALALPAERLPQFQMYRWAFVGETSFPISNNNNSSNNKVNSNAQNRINMGGSEFVPHINRLARLLNKKAPCLEKRIYVPGQPLINVATIGSLLQLQPFFDTLLRISQCGLGPHPASDDSTDPNTSKHSSPQGCLALMEKIVQKDFLEPLAPS